MADPATLRTQPVFIAGHRGMVGSALVRRTQALGYSRIVTVERAELDLRDAQAVRAFFAAQGIGSVIVAAARVGGIHANNTQPADFILDNLLIETSLIAAAHAAGVQRLLMLGSSCAYPRAAAQPMREEAMLAGPLEPTNEPYAIAKIAGIKLCESFNRQHGRDYRSVMPTNLYGPGDNFHPEHSHVVPALMRRFHEAARDGADEVRVWGTGQALREFLHVDDAAAACLFVHELAPAAWQSQTEPQRAHLNVGTGQDCSIGDLAGLLARVTGYRGRIVFDASRPDGTPRKLLDVTRLAALGWRASIGLEDGLRQTYDWYRRHGESARR